MRKKGNEKTIKNIIGLVIERKMKITQSLRIKGNKQYE